MSKIEKVVSKEHTLNFVVEDDVNLRARIDAGTLKEGQSKNLVLHLKETSFNMPQCVKVERNMKTHLSGLLINYQPLIPQLENEKEKVAAII